MKKRAISLLLVLTLVVCALPISAFAVGTPVATPSDLASNETFFFNKYGNYYYVNNRFWLKPRKKQI